MTRTRLAVTFLILAVVFFALYFSHRAAPERIIEKTRFYMGSLVEIKVRPEPGNDTKDNNLAIKKAFEEIGRIEAILSIFKEDSEISRINRLHKGEKLKICDEVFQLIEKSIDINRRTSGAFDITVKPLVDLWREAKTAKRMPREEDVRKALAKVGSQYIVLDKEEKTISFKKEGMAIDLGGVGQGYATDRAVQVLRDNGIENAITNSSGDMYCMGKRSEKELWKVGVQHPRRKNELFLKLRLKDMAIDTSGDYEKFFILEGRRYSHIIDPRIGYPVGDDVVSATVIAKDSTTADFLATALCVLGKDALDNLAAKEGVDAVLIYKEGENLRVKMTKGFKERYDVEEKAKF